MVQLAGTATGILVGAFFGVTAMVRLFIRAVPQMSQLKNIMKQIPALAGVATFGGEAAGVATAAVLGVSTVAVAATGGVMGGVIGRDAAENAETVGEAIDRAAKAVMDKGNSTLRLQ